MNVTVIRIALGASALILSAGAALSDDGTASGKCPSTQAQPANLLLFTSSTTTRHTNVSRVRYTAAHAMPPARIAAATGAVVACATSVQSGSANLN